MPFEQNFNHPIQKILAWTKELSNSALNDNPISIHLTIAKTMWSAKIFTCVQGKSGFQIGTCEGMLHRISRGTCNRSTSKTLCRSGSFLCWLSFLVYLLDFINLFISLFIFQCILICLVLVFLDVNLI